jgi:hypothetical protein
MESCSKGWTLTEKMYRQWAETNICVFYNLPEVKFKGKKLFLHF